MYLWVMLQAFKPPIQKNASQFAQNQMALGHPICKILQGKLHFGPLLQKITSDMGLPATLSKCEGVSYARDFVIWRQGVCGMYKGCENPL